MNLMWDAGCVIRDTRFEIRDAGYRMRYLVSPFSHRVLTPYLLSRIPHLASRIVILIVLWPASAYAHVQQGEAAGFLTGFLHPISGLDHVLAMVAVGLWGAQLGAPAIWVLPVAFPLVMAMGGMLGLMGVPVPGIEYGIAASAILLGAAVTARSARFARRDRVAGRGLRHLPWPRAWNRTPARSERLAL